MEKLIIHVEIGIFSDNEGDVIIIADVALGDCL